MVLPAYHCWSMADEITPEMMPAETWVGSSIERGFASTTVEATVQDCFDVGADVGSYPEWIESLTSVEILSTDELGRPAEVGYEAAGIGRRTSYVLGYDFSDAPHRISWHLIRGDLTREIEGSYRFRDVGEDRAGPLTEVDYELGVDLTVPLSGFIRRRAEDKILEAALQRFKRRVESLTQSS